MEKEKMKEKMKERSHLQTVDTVRLSLRFSTIKLENAHAFLKRTR
jgi:hypothetical protein